VPKLKLAIRALVPHENDAGIERRTLDGQNHFPSAIDRFLNR
jgi:hypothetical protein